MATRRKHQDASDDSVQQPIAPRASERLAPISLKWFVANLALLSVASLAIGYLWLLSYARTEGIPLRVHGDGVGALVPWVAGTAAALLATPAALLAMTAAMIHLPMLRGDASLHDYLRTTVWKGSADPGAMRMRMSFWAFGVPMFISACVLFLHVLRGWPGHAWIWFIVCAVIAASVVFPFLHRRAELDTFWWNAGFSYVTTSLLVTGFGMGVPAGFVTLFGISSDGAVLAILAIGGFFWWMVVSLIEFGKRDRLQEGIRGLALGSLAILLMASAFSDFASALAAASLRAMGLGGITVDLRLRAAPVSSVGNGRYELVLDTGSQLYIRRCDAPADSKGVEIIAWSSVEHVELNARVHSDSNACK